MKNPLSLFEEHIIKSNKSFEEVIFKIYSSPSNTLIVIDEVTSDVIGTISDGDIRYAIIGNLPKEKILAKDIANKNFLFISSEHFDPEKFIKLPSDIRLVPILEGAKLLNIYMKEEQKLFTNFDAVIMAGGFGKRMGSLTKSIPKPLLEIVGKPMIFQIIEKLAATGIKRIFISTHYLAEKIINKIGDGSRWNIKIEYLYEEKPLGTAGCLSLLPKDLKSNLIICNGDIISGINFSLLANFHNKEKADFTLVTQDIETQIDFGVVYSDGHKFKKIVEKPKISNQINAGIYCLKTDHLKMIDHKKHINMPEFIDRLSKKKYSVLIYPLFEEWNDVGNPSVLQKLNSKL